MTGVTLHSGLAVITAAAALALVLAAGYAQLRSSEAAVRLVVQVRRVALVAASLAAIAGAVLLLTGRRPHEGLHLLYGAIAVAVIPVAASMAARNSRRGALIHLLAGLLLLGVYVRLLSTG